MLGTPTPPWAPYLLWRFGTVERKIRVKGKQVKKTAGVEVRQENREASKLVEALLAAEKVPGEVSGRGRARAFREMARRLRIEALMLDIAAAEDEDREGLLSMWARVQRKWRQEAELKKSSGSATLQ